MTFRLEADLVRLAARDRILIDRDLIIRSHRSGAHPAQTRALSILMSALAAGAEDAGFWPVISSPSETT